MIAVRLTNFFNQGVQAGKSGGGDQKSLADQLVDANAAVGKVATEVKQSKMKIKHLEKELKEKKTQLSSKQKEATTIEKEHQTRTAEVKKITSTLQRLKFD
jgi:structural maintenance of chromosome 2